MKLKPSSLCLADCGLANSRRIWYLQVREFEHALESIAW